MRSRRRAFTILELLIVIGIILTLMALLLPSLYRTRQAAYQVTCLGNMRQISHAALVYASENSSQMPYCNWGTSEDTGVYGYGWLFATINYRKNDPDPVVAKAWNSGHPPPQGVKTGVLWQYLNTMTIYHCPADSPDAYTGTEWMTSYLWNGAECGYGKLSSTPGVQLRQMKSDSQAVLMFEGLEQAYRGESKTGAVWNDGASYPNEEVLADRHWLGANVACYDGHAEWWDKATWVRWVNDGNFGRLWCYPATSNGR